MPTRLRGAATPSGSILLGVQVGVEELDLAIERCAHIRVRHVGVEPVVLARKSDELVLDACTRQHLVHTHRLLKRHVGVRVAVQQHGGRVATGHIEDGTEPLE